MRRAVVITAAAAAGAACQLASTAAASTNATFTLVAGTLSISEPTSMSFGSAASNPAGTSLSGHLGSTTVTDTRGSVAGWTVSVAASDFTDGATPTPHTVAATNFKAYIAAGDGPTVSSGLAVPTTTYTTALTALALSTTAKPLLTATTTGSNIVTYNPTVVVDLGSSVVAGTYTGTITQSVS